MTLRLADCWLWDTWFVTHEGRHHAFYLKASRALGDPERRHAFAHVGHAVSDDLVHWTELADAIAPGPAGAFDDAVTWTGSVVQGHDGRWRMFYTGARRAERLLVQRIGVATSDDLLTWTTATQPVIEADPRWYELLEGSSWHDQAWRDPWVFADPDGHGWHMLITARSNSGEWTERGVIGHATSADLVDWTPGPPLSTPGAGFGHLEVVQVAEVDGRPVVVFSCRGNELTGRRRGLGSIWAAPAAGLTGPFDIEAAWPLTGDDLYSGRLVHTGERWALMAFRNLDGSGSFVGELADPMPVEWRGDRLVVDR